jgi:hypothetical protein
MPKLGTLERFRKMLETMSANDLWHLAEGYFNNEAVINYIKENLNVPLKGKQIIGAMMAKGIWDRFRKVHAKIFYPFCPSCYRRYI